MSVDPGAKIGIGTSVLVGAVVLIKKLWAMAKDEGKEEPAKKSVREWKEAQVNADALADIQATLRGIKDLLTVANLPAMVQFQATQAAEINSIKAGQVTAREDLDEFRREVRNEFVDLRRENDVRDDRLEKFGQRFTRLSDRVTGLESSGRREE